MPRKKNEQQELLKEQEEFDTTGNRELVSENEETQAPESEDEVLLVNQTYLTEDTLPEEVKNQPVMHHAEQEEEETEEEESEVEGAEYESEDETEEGEEYEEEGDEVEEEESEDETEEGEEDEYEEEGEGDLEEEGEYEYEEEGAGSPERSKIGLVIDRVMASIKDSDGNLDKAQIAKYAGVAVLGIYGLSRTSLLGKILISGVVSLLTAKLLEGSAARQENEVEEEEAVAA